MAKMGTIPRITRVILCLTTEEYEQMAADLERYYADLARKKAYIAARKKTSGDEGRSSQKSNAGRVAKQPLRITPVLHVPEDKGVKIFLV